MNRHSENTREKNDLLRIHAPQGGAQARFLAVPGVGIALLFNPEDATLSRDGDNLVFSFTDGGNATIADYFSVNGHLVPNFFLPGGAVVSLADLAQGTGLATAFGHADMRLSSDSSGIGEYADGSGSLVSGVDRLGSLGTDYWTREAAENGNLEGGGAHRAPAAATPAPVNPDPVEPTPVEPDPIGPDPEDPAPVDPDPTDPVVPDPVSATLTGKNTTEAVENTRVEFDLVLSRAPQGECRVLVEFTHKGEVIGEQWVTVGADGSVSFSVDNPNSEDVYRDPSSVTATIKDVQGGYDDTAGLVGANGSALIADTIDTTTANIGLAQNGADLVVTIMLDHGPDAGAPATVTYVVDGVTYVHEFKDGRTSFEHRFPGYIQANPYNDPTTVEAEITGFEGGNYEATAIGSDVAGSFVPPSATETVVTIAGVDTVEGSGSVRFEVSLSNPPKDGSATVTIRVEGVQYEVAVDADGKGYIDVPNSNGEDAFKDPGAIGAEFVKVEGGGYAKVTEGDNSPALIADTIDTTTVSLFVYQDDTGGYMVAVRVSVPARDDLVLKLSNGEIITIPAGKTGAELPFDPAKGGPSISVVGVEGYEDADNNGKTDYASAPEGGYEELDFSGASDVVNLPPDAVNDYGTIYQGDSSVTGSLLDNDSDPENDPLTVTGIRTEDGFQSMADEGITVAGKYGSITIMPDGSYVYHLDNDNDAVRNLDNGSLKESFTYEISDGKGGHDTAELEITVDDSRFISGDNRDNALTGGDGHDVIVGDTGGTTITPDQDYNVALIMDTSGSMSVDAIEQAKAALEHLVIQLAKHGDTGAAMNVVLISFDMNASILWQGPLTSANLADIIKAINSLDGHGSTNFESAFNAANKWFGSLGDAVETNENQIFFITDGKPAYHYLDPVKVGPVSLHLPGDYIVGDLVYYDANGNLLPDANGAMFRIDETGAVLKNAGSGTWQTLNHVSDGNRSDEEENREAKEAYDRLLDSIGGDVKVNVVGIGPDTNKELLDPYDNTGGAQIISDAGELDAALQEAGSAHAEVGADTIHGGAGNDIIFGDALYADHLLPQDESGDNAWASGLGKGDSLAIVRAYLEAGLANIDGANYTTGPGNTVTNDDLRRYVQDHAFELARDDGRGKDDILYGDAGDDILFGQGGNDTLFGGSGNDILVGGTGDDILFGGTGNDILYGGSGADIFAWTASDLDGGHDTIMDFSFAEGDRINFSDLISSDDSLDDLLGFLTITSVDAGSGALSLQAAHDGGKVDVSVNFQGNELQAFVDSYVEAHGDTSGLNDALLAAMLQNVTG